MNIRRIVIGSSTALGATSRQYVLLLVIAGAVVAVAYVSYCAVVLWVARQGIEHPKAQDYLLKVLDRLKRPPPWK